MGDTPQPNILTDDEISALELQHRRIGRVTHDEGDYEFAFGPAQKLQWRTFRAAANDEDKRGDAQETLVKATVVACVYKGERALEPKAARALLDRLLLDYVSASDGREIFRLLFKVNGQAAPGK